MALIPRIRDPWYEGHEYNQPNETKKRWLFADLFFHAFENPQRLSHLVHVVGFVTLGVNPFALPEIPHQFRPVLGRQVESVQQFFGFGEFGDAQAGEGGRRRKQDNNGGEYQVFNDRRLPLMLLEFPGLFLCGLFLYIARVLGRCNVKFTDASRLSGPWNKGINGHR